MALIQVTAAELTTKANELRGLNGRFKSQVGNLESQEAALASMWEGEAKTAFHTAFNNDKTQMNAFYDLIEKYCQALETIAQKYGQAEAQNAEIASSRSYSK
ncbi:MAG: WXG100 family type VII secretion target [Lachnospiraceae bacterium]|nr:WXG100 family type VII secretion target [Lachnospiraceae bacterium]